MMVIYRHSGLAVSSPLTIRVCAVSFAFHTRTT